MSSRLYYILAMAGYFALLGLLMTWTMWIKPSTTFPVVVVLVLYVGPLLFPLRGMLSKKLYTFGWTQFMSLFYFTAGVWAASHPDERWLGLLQILFSLAWFVGGMLFIRATARNNK